MRTAQRRKERNNFGGIAAFDVLVFLYIAHNYLPAVGFYMPAIVYFGIFAILSVFLLVTVGSSPRFPLLIAVFVLNIFALLRTLFTSDLMTMLLGLYGDLQTFLFGWIVLKYALYKNDKNARRLWFVLIAFFIMTAITTIIGNNKYPGASRLLATPISQIGADVYNKYVSSNIGGFTFIYGLVLVMPILIYLAKKKRINPILSIVMFAIMGFAVIASEYTTALILFLMNIFLFFFRKLTKRKIVILVLICILFVAIGSVLLASLFDGIADLLPGDTVSLRLEYLASTLRGEDVLDHEGDSNRAELYKKALMEIRESNLLGTWGKTTGSGHSLILDAIVRYGIIGILLLVVMYIAIYKYSIYPYKNEDYGPYLLWIYLVAIILAFLNPKTNLTTFIFVIPLFTLVQKTVEDNS